MNDWEHEFMKEPEPMDIKKRASNPNCPRCGMPVRDIQSAYWCDSTDHWQSQFCEVMTEKKEVEEKLKTLRQEVATLKLSLDTANQFRDSWEEKYRKLREDVGTLLLLVTTNPIQPISPEDPALQTLRSTLNEG